MTPTTRAAAKASDVTAAPSTPPPSPRQRRSWIVASAGSAMNTSRTRTTRSSPASASPVSTSMISCWMKSRATSTQAPPSMPQSTIRYAWNATRAWTATILRSTSGTSRSRRATTARGATPTSSCRARARTHARVARAGRMTSARREIRATTARTAWTGTTWTLRPGRARSAAPTTRRWASPCSSSSPSSWFSWASISPAPRSSRLMAEVPAASPANPWRTPSSSTTATAPSGRSAGHSGRSVLPKPKSVAWKAASLRFRRFWPSRRPMVRWRTAQALSETSKTLPPRCKA
mmetsp:Transcript_9767/g.28677  ORF Transcript_9767/g.28677 Transcript_9767/m.28677 type:complete len:291 (+) Transcript_9767:1235-2107(+)